MKKGKTGEKGDLAALVLTEKKTNLPTLIFHCICFDWRVGGGGGRGVERGV